jgi:hypothetical protein
LTQQTGVVEGPPDDDDDDALPARRHRGGEGKDPSSLPHGRARRQGLRDINHGTQWPVDRECVRDEILMITARGNVTVVATCQASSAAHAGVD